MSLAGQLSTMPVSEVFRYVGTTRKTGLLTVHSGTLKKEVAFEAGTALYCSSGAAKELLGHHLLASLPLTEQDIEDAFRTQKITGCMLGEILIMSGKITPDQLDSVLRRKVEDSLFELFAWSAGEFEFEEVPVSDSKAPVRLDIAWEDAVREGQQRSTSRSSALDVLGGPTACPRRRPDAGAPSPTPGTREHWLLSCVDRELSVAEICLLSHESNDAVMLRLVELLESGAIEMMQAPAKDAPVAREILALGAELTAQGRLAEARRVYRDGHAAIPTNTAIVSHLQAAEIRLADRLRGIFGSLDGVPEFAVTCDRLSTWKPTPLEAAVLSRINAQWSLKSIAALCPFDELDVLDCLEGFLRRGIIKVLLTAAPHEDDRPALRAVAEGRLSPSKLSAVR